MRIIALVAALLGAQAIALTAQTLKPEAGYTDRFVVNEGRRIHYLDWGSAEKTPFIMLHGIGRSAHSYDYIAPHFLREYHVIAMDLRGHGDSDWHPAAAYLVEDYVKDLERLVEQLNLSGIVLTGSSTGGRVAQVYAGLHPERVAKLIVEDVGPEG
jgi:pimeloyl-ACP methyl ester carboxylesterase